MPDFYVPPLSDEFTAAICDVPRMTLNDRLKLAHLLPEVIKISPDFGLSLGEKLAADQSKKVHEALFGVTESILNQNKDTGFHILKGLVHRGHEITSKIISEFDMLISSDFEATIMLAHDIIRETQAAHMMTELGEKLPFLFGKAKNDTQKRSVFELGKALADNSPSSIPDFMDNISVFIPNYPDDVRKFIDSSLMPEEDEARFDTHLSIVKNLMSFAMIDPQWATSLMIKIFQYNPGPDDTPVPPGSDPYAHIKEKIIMQLGDLAPLNPEAIFTFAESCSQKGYKRDLSQQLTALAKIDLGRSLAICVKLCVNNTGNSWRAFAEPLVELTAMSENEILYGLIDRLLDEGDVQAIQNFSEKMHKLKVPKEMRDAWARKIYEKPELHKREGSDAIKTAVAAITDQPALDARAQMAVVLNQLALKF